MQPQGKPYWATSNAVKLAHKIVSVCAIGNNPDFGASYGRHGCRRRRKVDLGADDHLAKLEELRRPPRPVHDPPPNKAPATATSYR